MNKSQLVKLLSESQGLPVSKAEEVVDTFFGEIERAFINSERVEIRGFFSFKIKHYKGYKGRNPKTGDQIEVKPKRLPFFKVGKDLRQRVDIK